MSVWRSASRCSSILILSATAVCAFAQAPSPEYTPEVGQSGKDVVWVPSPQELVDRQSEAIHRIWSETVIALKEWRKPKGVLRASNAKPRPFGNIKVTSDCISVRASAPRSWPG